MEIHELNTKALTDPGYVAVDDGIDTYKADLNNLLTQNLGAAESYTDAALVTAKNYSDGKLSDAVDSLEAEITAATTITFLETNSAADSVQKSFAGYPTLTQGQFIAVKFNNGNTSNYFNFSTRQAHSSGGFDCYFMGSLDAPTFPANTVLFFYFAPVEQGEYVPKYHYLGYWSRSGGSGGTSDYTDLTNKPQINSVTLSGNKSFTDLGIDTYIDTYIAANYEDGDSATY